MQTGSRLLVAVVVILICLMWGHGEVVARDTSGEVVILQCAPTPNNPQAGATQQYAVTVATSSAGAPAVTPATNCADAVAGLLADGFKLSKAVPGGMGNVIYTLIRR